MMKCELCKSPATLYCESDQASLCTRCDVKVHEANFLVSRHSRTLLCRTCQGRTPWEASGATLGTTSTVCDKCERGDVDDGDVHCFSLDLNLSPPAASSSSSDESSSASSVCYRKRVHVIKRMRKCDAESCKAVYTNISEVPRPGKVLRRNPENLTSVSSDAPNTTG